MSKLRKIFIVGGVGSILIGLAENASAGEDLLSKLSDILKNLEQSNKVKLKASNDGYGTVDIGYGSTYNWDNKRPVKIGDTIDIATAERWLRLEASQDIDTVANLVKVQLTNNEKIALASLCYNIGITNFTNSTLLKLLNSGKDLQTVAAQFDNWVWAGPKGKKVKSKGLVARRNFEKKLFLK